ncbi:alpha/beta fold hydrolase [Ferrimonas sediminicola]|uniref:Alpha/beta fold hydrolase n=1 Tax=Ferrimonas sediminicola TaxID=2569538 RepID=A0A4U1BBX9_9GAMM|nr:alpha/beta fold hydrolase [Ferrimonas sediminicola]TKB48130.1 alpha/beta fold hydrolase [Ferrimonas sediminicola]
MMTPLARCRSLLLAAVTLLPGLADANPAALTPCYLDGLNEQVQCGSLRLPEDYDRPQGRKIEVHFARIPAIKQVPGLKPLLAITGGPGQSALDDAALFEKVFSRIRQKRDLILIDQRGTGRSNLLSCDDQLFDDPLVTNDETLDYPRLLGECLEQLDADVRHYDSLTALMDFEQIRRHLGIDSWHLYGISYGTRMAQLYMRHHPQVLKTVTLDGVVPMDQPVVTISDAVTRASELLYEECHQDPHCQSRFGDLKQKLADLLNRLKRQPVALPVTDPISAERTTFLVTQNKLQGALRMALYSPSSRALIPYTIDQAWRDNFQPLLGMQMTSESDGFGIALGMHLSVICAEDQPRLSAAEAKRLSQASLTGKTMVNLFSTACQLWRMPAVDEAFGAALTSDIPTLLLSGEKDPATPPAWGIKAQAGLSNSLHLIAPYATHGVAFQSCAPRLIQQLIDSGTLAELNGECLQTDTRRAFYLNANGVEPVTRLK